MSKKALLMILDGWGIGDHKKDDVIFNTPTPYWDSLLAHYPHSQLQASGENVGLPDGQMAGFGENQPGMCGQQHHAESGNRVGFFIRQREGCQFAFHGIDF